MTLAAQLVTDLSPVFFTASDFGATVTYSRGGAEVSLTAIAQTDVSEMFSELGTTKASTRTYLIIASQLDLGAGVTTPLAGDTITEGTDVWIIPKHRDKVPYETLDENSLILRINTTRKA